MWCPIPTVPAQYSTAVSRKAGSRPHGTKFNHKFIRRIACKWAFHEHKATEPTSSCRACVFLSAKDLQMHKLPTFMAPALKRSAHIPKFVRLLNSINAYCTIILTELTARLYSLSTTGHDAYCSTSAAQLQSHCIGTPTHSPYARKHSSQCCNSCQSCRIHQTQSQTQPKPGTAWLTTHPPC